MTVGRAKSAELDAPAFALAAEDAEGGERCGVSTDDDTAVGVEDGRGRYRNAEIRR